MKALEILKYVDSGSCGYRDSFIQEAMDELKSLQTELLEYRKMFKWIEANSNDCLCDYYNRADDEAS